MKVLFLAASPHDRSRVRFDRELRSIRASLRAAGATDVLIDAIPAVMRSELAQAILDRQADVIHFSGHGTDRGELEFEDEFGRAQPVSAAAFARLLRDAPVKPRCVFLSACYSDAFGQALSSYVSSVIGVSNAIPDEASIAFAESFYMNIAQRRDVQASVELARTQLALSIDDGADPIVFRSRESDGRIVLNPAPELSCEFVLNSRKKPTHKGYHYEIRIFVRNLPRETLSVTYHLNHDSFGKEAYTEIPNDGRQDFEHFITTYGDIEVRAMVWNALGGYGLRTRIASALRRRYQNSPAADVAKAIEVIADN